MTAFDKIVLEVVAKILERHIGADYCLSIWGDVIEQLNIESKKIEQQLLNN